MFRTSTRATHSARFAPPEPDLADAEAASEEGHALHMDDASDWQRLEALRRERYELQVEDERDLRLVSRVHIQMRERAQAKARLLHDEEQVISRIRARQPHHEDGHRLVSGILDDRQRKVGSIRVRGARELDLDIEA